MSAKRARITAAICLLVFAVAVSSLFGVMPLIAAIGVLLITPALYARIRHAIAKRRQSPVLRDLIEVCSTLLPKRGYEYFISQSDNTVFKIYAGSFIGGRFYVVKCLQATGNAEAFNITEFRRWPRYQLFRANIFLGDQLSDAVSDAFFDEIFSAKAIVDRRAVEKEMTQLTSRLRNSISA